MQTRLNECMIELDRLRLEAAQMEDRIKWQQSEMRRDELNLEIEHLKRMEQKYYFEKNEVELMLLKH